MSDERASTNVRVLLDNLALIDQADGMPAIVLVHDYAEREVLVEAVRDEATIYGIDVMVFDSVDAAASKLTTLSAAANQAIALLIRAGESEAWGRWLEASRERFPAFCRFEIIFVLETDFPALARTAPAFLSWAKGRLIERLVIQREESARGDVADEVRRMQAETGCTPVEFLKAWERGEVIDTYANNVWLNVARAAVGGG